jgi:predicted metalloprotease with PDZ domain
MSNGRKSLNDFTSLFHGLNGNTAPKVVPYTFEDVVAALNTVVANDWAGFLRERIESHSPTPPLGGIANGGYELVYKDTPNSWSVMEEQESGSISFWYSLGLAVGAQGVVGDVLVGGISDKAGFGPGMKILAVNGREFTPDLLRSAVRDAKGLQEPIEFIVENTGFFKVIKLDYHEGEKYPALQRVAGTPDRLDDVLKPMVK